VISLIIYKQPQGGRGQGDTQSKPNFFDSCFDSPATPKYPQCRFGLGNLECGE